MYDGNDDDSSSVHSMVMLMAAHRSLFIEINDSLSASGAERNDQLLTS